MQNNLFSLLADTVNITVKKQPFKHIIIDKLFHKPFYNLMCNEFNLRLSKGLEDNYSTQRFWKFDHYDAWCWTFNPIKDRIFSNIFYSPYWKRFINGFFNLKLTNNMLAEFHYHKIGSKSGYVHNDYDLSSFKNEPLENGINPWFHQCVYRGRANEANHCVRSIAMLYYFNNPLWTEGDGGETGLYVSHDDLTPITKIPPINNRLLAFEISPKSFHAFATNKKNIRNSMVMWMHSNEEYMEKRYGTPAK
jgi:2OG-Fe(II) oxygenase superfamily